MGGPASISQQRPQNVFIAYSVFESANEIPSSLSAAGFISLFTVWAPHSGKCRKHGLLLLGVVVSEYAVICDIRIICAVLVFRPVKVCEPIHGNLQSCMSFVVLRLCSYLC